MPAKKPLPAIYFAHDHMDRPEDFARDLNAGVTGKILHLVVDGWLAAPTRDLFEASYYGYEGHLERGLIAVSQALSHADNPDNRLQIVRNVDDLASAETNGKLALILGTEGGKLIKEDIALLDVFFRLGLRHIELNWAMRNQIGSSQANEDEPDQSGLTPFGRTVVQRMNELGMIVDVSHSSPAAIKEVLGLTTKPVLNSHGGSRELANKGSNQWDDQIRDMADNGGVIGVHFCSRLVLGVNDRQSEIPDLMRQIRHVMNVGGLDVVGLGPDFILGDDGRDPNYKRNTNQPQISWTVGLESSAEIANIVPALEKDGFSTTEIEMILGGNLSRLFNDVLPSGSSRSM
ncbi:MAG: membrane dipeptidase [Chloroflexi bacterium]|nr:membrane dipeptidase [Chloroflexota bacterium]